MEGKVLNAFNKISWNTCNPVNTRENQAFRVYKARKSVLVVQQGTESVKFRCFIIKVYRKEIHRYMYTNGYEIEMK